MIQRILILLFLFVSYAPLGFSQSKKKGKEANLVSEPAKSTIQGIGVMEFIYDVHNFRSISEKGGLVFHDFKFINLGKGPINITDVITSCGCTQSNWTRTPIKPGDTGVVRATFDPNGRVGEFEKTLTVVSDGSPNSYAIRIKGHVYPTKLSPGDSYKYQYGNLAIKTNSI
jgi:hypothetical protein